MPALRGSAGAVAIGLIWLLTLLLWVHPTAARAQAAEELGRLREEIEALRAGQAAILRQLQEIQRLLQPGTGTSPTGPEMVVDIDGAPFRGDPGARVTIVEFSDYQCPFCLRHFRDALGEIERDYVGAGKVRYVFRDFPIEAIHPDAFKAAEAAHCAGEQGRYWPMHDRLFEHQDALSEPALREHAGAVGLDRSGFEACLASGRFARRVQEGLIEGLRLGVSGTPSFFLGVTDGGGGTIRVRRVLRGVQPYPSFKQAIDELLASPR